MKLIIGAGGTGGHIIPAIAIAQEMSARGWEIAFIGNKGGMEEAIVGKNGFDFFPINVQKIYRKFTLAHLRFPFLLLKSLILCIGYISKQKPRAVLCTGGFVSGPVALGAMICKVSLYFQDGNSYPGLTTRWMAKYTRHIFTASDIAKKHLPANKCLFTGNPLLPYVKQDVSAIDWSALNLSAEAKKLFIIGGSQGSLIINNAVGSCIDSLLADGIEIIWQTGKAHKTAIQTKYGSLKGVHIFDFTDKMNLYYQIADLAISRAGALSIAELEEHRIPAVFIPLPIAAENHQYVNALAQAESGKGIVLKQSGLNRESLLNAIREILQKYDFFSSNLENTPVNNATKRIADTIIQETDNKAYHS